MLALKRPEKCLKRTCLFLYVIYWMFMLVKMPSEITSRPRGHQLAFGKYNYNQIINWWIKITVLFVCLFFLSWFFFFFNCYSVTIVCIFSPSLHPTPANPTSLPYLYPPPWFCLCVLYSSSCKSLSPLSPPLSPLGFSILTIISPAKNHKNYL